MPRRERLFAIVLGGIAAAAVLWLVFTFDWSQQGSQYRQIGEQAFQRRPVRAADYEYVADHGTKQYWPNREPYISRIPSSRRVYILDREALRQFKGYSAGPR